MAEYIEREAVLADEITYCLPYSVGKAAGRVVVFAEDIEAIPAADVAPVVHGRWGVTQVNGVDAIFACSECSREVKATNAYFGKPTEHIAKIYPYCHCGAKMDLEGGNK